MRKILATVLLSALLAACSDLPLINPLYSAWYMQYDDKLGSVAGSSPKMYVALLNRDKKAISVQSVILNRDPDGWELTDLPSKTVDKPILLEPGKLVVFQAQAFKKAASGETFDKSCLLPVELAVRLAKEQQWSERWVRLAAGDPPGIIRADLVGRMPSELPAGWVADCALPAKETAKADATH